MNNNGIIFNDDDNMIYNPVKSNDIRNLEAVFKLAYTLKYIEWTNENIIRALRVHLCDEYESGKTLREYRVVVGRNHLGSFNSILSSAIGSEISYRMKQQNIPYIKKDQDEIDWIVNNTCGDSKFAIAQEDKIKNWTGNGSSKKRGFYWLHAVRLDPDVPLKETKITHLYGGLIAVEYVFNDRDPGDSDRTDMKILKTYSDKILSLYGDTIERGKKWLQFRLAPVVY